MENGFEEIFPRKLRYKRYDKYNDYLLDCYNYVEMGIIYYLKYISSKLQGNEEESNEIQEVGLKSLREAELHMSLRIHSTENPKSILAYNMKETYKFYDLEWFCIIMSVMMEIDEYKKFILDSGILEDDKTLNYDIFLKIFFMTDDVYSIEGYDKIISDLKYKLEGLIFDKVDVSVDKGILPMIIFNKMDVDNISGIKVLNPEVTDRELAIREEEAKKISSFLSTSDYRDSFYFYVHGAKGSGRNTIINRAMSIMNMVLVRVDIKECDVDDPKNFNNTIMTASRYALMLGGGICIENFDILEENESREKYIYFVLDTVKKFSRVVFVVSQKEKHAGEYRRKRMWIDIPVNHPSKEESIILWGAYLDDENKSVADVEPSEMANKFTFTPGQIESTMEQAKITYMWKGNKKLNIKELCECAYSQIVQNLSDKATLIHSKHNWSQLVLEEKEKNMLKDACDQVRYKHIVYDQWGMKDRLMYGRGVSMLFAGPPGTGKTMAAQVIANELGIDIYKVDLSKIVSKYIGETEKNLGSLFEEAKKSSVILFFDETDALFGKRTEVKDSHDKNANLETSYLLQKMEEYDGITIMTTNYLENIDKAFFRRISYVIHFAFPGSVARKKIWMNMYPKQMPISKDIDFDFLSKQFEIAGGNIKNIVLSSAFMAAREKCEVNMKHIMKATKYELAKQGKVMLKDDFGPYSYLLDM